MSEVTIVGSLSRDLVVKAPRMPKTGETLRGSDFGMFAGGKGNNQALAAARAGAKTSMVGRVGKDQFGEELRGTLEQNHVDHRFLIADESVGTGIAVITVDEKGGNAIVIAQQANLKLSPDDVRNAAKLIQESKVLLMQLEVRFETVIEAAKVAHESSKKVLVILNPAPAPSKEDGALPAEMLKQTDVFVPNQTEAEQLCDIAVTDSASALKACLALQKLGPKRVIITMGEEGSYFLDESAREGILIPPYKVKAIDSTAAGDAFCGALSAALARGESWETAISWGSAAGALACTKLGAEPSLPKAEEIRALVASQAKAAV